MKKALVTLAILGTSAMAGNVANGKNVYNTTCASCHNTGVGPSLAHIGNTPASSIKESIVNPSAKITAGYANIMPPFASLGDSTVNDLVAYLKTQK
jgi:mono/diheme cytochrome c family protein